jgi:hypothetical protein
MPVSDFESLMLPVLRGAAAEGGSRQKISASAWRTISA